MREIVYVTQENQDRFIEKAISLGYEEITLIYEKKPQNIPTHSQIKIKTGLIEKKGFDEILLLGTSISALPKKATLLVNNEFDTEKDFVHQRRSGLNHVFIKECKKKNITLLLNISKLRSLPLEKQGIILGRMKQNAKLARKYGVSFEVVSMARNVEEIRSRGDMQRFKQELFL
jgi:hypothetical protein